jgi:hypothetical protein
VSRVFKPGRGRSDRGRFRERARPGATPTHKHPRPVPPLTERLARSIYEVPDPNNKTRPWSTAPEEVRQRAFEQARTAMRILSAAWHPEPGK